MAQKKKTVKKAARKSVSTKTSPRTRTSYSNNVKAIIGFFIIALGFVEFLMFVFNQDYLLRSQLYNTFVLLFGFQLVLVLIFYYLVSRK